MERRYTNRELEWAVRLEAEDAQRADVRNALREVLEQLRAYHALLEAEAEAQAEQEKWKGFKGILVGGKC